jgi:hypothetical protein
VTSQRPEKHANLLHLVRQCVENGSFVETLHAKQRQEQRKIILPDILHVLMTGHHEKRKDSFDEAWQSWNYAIRGKTVSDLELRVIVTFDEEVQLMIITAFYVEERRQP